MKSLILAGNWKLNKTPQETATYLEQLSKQFSSQELQNLILFPSATSLHVFQQKKSQLVGLQWGPQNVHGEMSGAFTGENSVQASLELGSRVFLLGHSERRQYFHETDDDIAKKAQLVQAVGATPMICVGETLEQRESEQTFEVIFYQLRKSLALLDVSKKFLLAYEPVWAIGTGKVATPEIAEEVHMHIRGELAEMFSASVAKSVPLLYGGSVKPNNAKALFAKENIDGFLVGGASLKCEDFYDIYRQSCS